jgi:hypothetical protein
MSRRLVPAVGTYAESRHVFEFQLDQKAISGGPTIGEPVPQDLHVRLTLEAM